ncbi:hypothetical protein JRO89_XS08G0161100 [Xanthoceras sorbifolium]|uniref:Uncharacterized protein n=1 Tax=Xanthoceras sorbifolium TaxID=99658 RepID=A0ABQ8HQ49_9ROSI|nr:hypothetical protein JRO89_XS08G0161100 [Xanthoceras sorbifolium]
MNQHTSSRTKYSVHRIVTSKLPKSSSFQMTKVVRITCTDCDATDSDSSSDENDDFCRSSPSSHPIRVKKHINEIKIEDGSREITSENGTSNNNAKPTIQEANSKSNGHPKAGIAGRSNSKAILGKPQLRNCHILIQHQCNDQDGQNVGTKTAMW